MSDTVYNVEIRMGTSGGFSAGLDAAGSKAGKLDSLFERAGEKAAGIAEKLGASISGAVDRVVELGTHIAKIGVAGGIGLATYGVAKLNNELEQTTISLGAIAQARGFAKTFEDGFGLAQDQVSKMKQDVKTLPGDLGQLSNMMKMIATPAAQGGAGLDQIRQLAGRTMLTAAILNVPQEVAEREMAGLLAGRAGSHNILGSRLGLIGDDAKKFNAAAPAQRLERINKELDKYQGAADRFGHSFVANWTTLKDNVKYGFIAEATQPLFQHVIASMERLNGYIDENKDKIKSAADAVGHELANEWDRVEKLVIRVVGWIDKGVERIKEMKPGELQADMKRAGEGLLAAKVGGSILESGLLGSLFKAGGSALGMLGAGGAGAGAAGIGGVAALGLAADGLAAGAALHVLTNESSSLQPVAKGLADDIRVRLGDSMTRLATDIEPLEGAFVKMVDLVGTGVLGALDMGIRQLDSWIQAFEYMTSKIRAGAEWIFGGPKLNPDTAPPISVDHQIGEDVARHLVRMSKNEGPGGSRPAVGAGGGGGGMHIQKVEIVVASNQDPSMIARLTAAKLAELSRYPRASRLAANYSASR